MSCNKEEIERKRLAALQRRQTKVLGLSAVANSPVINTASNKISSPVRASYSSGPVKGFQGNNGLKTFHPYAKPETSKPVNNSVPVSKVVNGSTYLISEDRFEVNPSEFCTPLIEIFKTIPSKSYDSRTKLWSFSINDYHDLMSKVAPLAPHVVIGPIPAFVLKILKEEFVDPRSIDLSLIEPELRNKLMPFQEEGVRFSISRGGRCLIADDMGLGKTFQALAVASYYRHTWPILIVTTSSMRETWQSKVHELLPSVPLMNIATLTSGKDASLVADRQTEVVIVSFKITTMHTDLLINKKFGFIVIDESHYLKCGSSRSAASLRLVSRGARVLLLSGTPALSRPRELHSQLHLLQPGLVPSYTQYGVRYCAGKQTTFGWDMSGQSHATELQVLLEKKFLIRRTKEQVLTNLQQKTRETVILDQSLLNFSSEDKASLSQLADSYKRKHASDKHAALLSFFSESARVKIPAICKYLKQVVAEESTGKFLVFAHHRSVLEAACLTLDELAVSYICIVGSTPTTTRAELVDKFQFSSACRVAVLSVTAAGAGLTLTAASLVLFAELHWNPGVLSQAEARAHRLGQRGCVCARYLLARGTVDDYIWPMLQNKLNVLNNVGLSCDSYEGTATTHQDSKNGITQYLDSPIVKNKNDYIPGTNIRKYPEKTETTTKEQSFLDDDEDDLLLANLDL